MPSAAVLLVVLLAAGCSRPTGQVLRAADGSEVRGNPTRGAELFGRMGCNGCHTVNGVGGQVGPDLTGVARLDLARDRPGRTWPSVVAYLRESIEAPQAYIVPTFENPSRMPSAKQFKLSDRDVNDLLAYLLSLQR
ncbi:MAG: cytochrome c [Armatimonadota bacterium]|nr:cytochrome c [Armatimonadota bacterium]MDR7485888.1 cytochrome c [Armatimonadota bacterium]MDR7533161.1 cytochrome c [Armatimonadota bacterium]